ncbi:response regulator transcription factor [Paenibacillus pinistramenti]|uniref:response regulator transcription factor n=1 Tax=Paenibacillus pinistramenti TaxID=1768003 RepID=UPI001108337F|nr:response regulator [Paenibacillus pinistramenti]
MYSYVIIDDEPLIRKGLIKKINSVTEEFQFCGEADNGEDALLLVKQVDPDLIFTDMRMPVMDGKSLLKRLQKDYPRQKIIVISGYSDFEYMQEAISAKVLNYLLKPFSREEIYEALNKAITDIQKERSERQQLAFHHMEKDRVSFQRDAQIVLNYILGVHVSATVPTFQSQAFQLFHTALFYRLVMVYSPVDIPEEDPFEEQTMIYLPHPQSKKLAFLIVYTLQNNSSDLERIPDKINKWIEAFQAKEMKDISIGISQLKTKFDELNEARLETTAALNYRKLSEHNICSTWNEDSFNLGEDLIWDRTEELVFFIESGNMIKVEKLIGELFEFYYSKPSVTLHVFKEHCRIIVSSVKEMMNRYFLNQSLSSSSLEDVLNLSFDTEEIRDYFKTILTSLTELMKDKTVYSSPNVIDNIKSFIHQNYSSSITLERMSELFFLNPSYLSYLFKEKTGVNLIDYVNQVRIDYAKSWLKDSNEKIYKIAKKLGYGNAKYFFRIFKKTTGYTPEEYRQIYRL